MGGEPRPRRRVYRVGLGPARWRALGLCASCSPGAPRPSPRRPSRASMGQEEELLKIARKLEKMVARKNTVRLQSSGHSPHPQEARRVRAWCPGGACWLRAREARAGTPGPEGGAADAGLSAPWRLLGTPGVHVYTAQGACWAGSCGAPKTSLVHAPLDKWGSGVLGSLCRARESERRDRDLEKDFQSPGLTECVKPGEWLQRQRGGKKGERRSVVYKIPDGPKRGKET